MGWNRKFWGEESSEPEHWRVKEAEISTSLGKGALFGMQLQMPGGLGRVLTAALLLLGHWL